MQCEAEVIVLRNNEQGYPVKEGDELTFPTNLLRSSRAGPLYLHQPLAMRSEKKLFWWVIGAGELWSQRRRHPASRVELQLDGGEELEVQT